MQVEVQLPVGKLVRELVGHHGRQRGLADAAHAVDRANHLRRAVVRQHTEQARLLGVPAGEVGRRAGQLPRDRQVGYTERRPCSQDLLA
jgi:hypothetical protein